MVDQQQQLQLATVAENNDLKEHVRKLSSLIEISKPVQQQEDGKEAKNVFGYFDIRFDFS